jgi:hypothetical protein
MFLSLEDVWASEVSTQTSTRHTGRLSIGSHKVIEVHDYSRSHQYRPAVRTDTGELKCIVAIVTAHSRRGLSSNKPGAGWKGVGSLPSRQTFAYEIC